MRTVSKDLSFLPLDVSNMLYILCSDHYVRVYQTGRRHKPGEINFVFKFRLVTYPEETKSVDFDDFDFDDFDFDSFDDFDDNTVETKQERCNGNSTFLTCFDNMLYIGGAEKCGVQVYNLKGEHQQTLLIGKTITALIGYKKFLYVGARNESLADILVLDYNKNIIKTIPLDFQVTSLVVDSAKTIINSEVNLFVGGTERYSHSMQQLSSLLAIAIEGDYTKQYIHFPDDTTHSTFEHVSILGNTIVTTQSGSKTATALETSDDSSSFLVFSRFFLHGMDSDKDFSYIVCKDKELFLYGAKSTQQKTYSKVFELTKFHKREIFEFTDICVI